MDTSPSLQRADWDFTNLRSEELLPALAWEFRRERPDLGQIAAQVRAWLDGKLSERKPPMRKDEQSGKHPRHNTNLSEADTARIRAMAMFPLFIPLREFHCAHNLSPEEHLKAQNRWLAHHVSLLLANCHLPWLGLAAEERKRLATTFEAERSAEVVTIGAWWDAVGYFEQHKPDPGLPLRFDFAEYTSVLLTMDWRNGRKRILAQISTILKQLEPAGIKRWDRRGKKHRDFLVMLERLAMMRLLHHYTLSELKRLAPDAWHLYQNRKWYDERRRCLKDFRCVMHWSEPEKLFPKSWNTKAWRTAAAHQLPGK